MTTATVTDRSALAAALRGHRGDHYAGRTGNLGGIRRSLPGIRDPLVFRSELLGLRRGRPCRRS